MTLAEELQPDLAAIDATLAQLKRCIADNDPEDVCRWAAILEGQVADLRRYAMLTWELADDPVCEGTAYHEAVEA